MREGEHEGESPGGRLSEPEARRAQPQRESREGGLLLGEYAQNLWLFDAGEVRDPLDGQAGGVHAEDEATVESASDFLDGDVGRLHDFEAKIGLQGQKKGNFEKV